MLILRPALFLLIFLCASSAIGQRLDHVLGEVLVEVRDDSGMRSLMSEINADPSYRSTISARQVMVSPMNIWVLSVDPDTDNELAFLESVLRSRHTLLAQQNHITQLRDTIPNDSLFVNQWQYINTGANGGVAGADIDIELAWEVTTGGITIDGDTIVVCVIDDGINPDHPDLGDNLWINTEEIPDNGVDDDGNGYIDDVYGWNAYNNDDNVYTGGSHGTPVAGIIGAQGNNVEGVTGVNWDVKLMIVRGGSPESTALASYAYPYTMRDLYNKSDGAEGAFVVSTNASWGIDFGDPEDAPIWCEFYNKLGEVGILNFGATINGNTNVDEEGDLPTACSSDYLVSVTNMNRQDDKVNGAGYGKRTIDLGAFGADTYTLSLNGYRGFGGTSGATPHCAGTAALLYSADCTAFMSVVKSDPARAALAVKDYILYGVDANPSLEGITTTGGRLNVNNAMQNLLNSCADCSEAYGLSVDEISIDGGTLNYMDSGNIGEVSLRYRILDDSTWTEVVGITSGYEFVNLESCLSYEYQVKTSCNGQEGEYSYARVFETEGCCVAPQQLQALVSEAGIEVSWEELPFSSNTTMEYRIAGEEEWTALMLGTANSFLLTDIAECRLYEVRLKSECAVSNNESDYTEIFSVSTDCGACTEVYCSFGEKNTSDEWIQFVGIGDILAHESGPSEGGYENNAGRYDSPLRQGENYEITLIPGYADNNFPEYFSVYIDFNQDAELQEEELVFQNVEEVRDTATGIISIPAEALLGITRMRVVMRWNAPNGACDDDNFEYGEIEDYCVTITELVSAQESIIEEELVISPNPVEERISIDVPLRLRDNAQIKITSISGQVVKRLQPSMLGHRFEMDMDDIPNGIYLIEIANEQTREVRKFVKI